MGFVVVGFVEPDGVAGEAELGQDGLYTTNLVGVVLSLAAVKDWWVKYLGDVLQGCWHVGQCREACEEEGVKSCVVVDEGGSEEETFVRVVAGHYGNVLVELATCKQLAG